MENPATWNKATRIISHAISESCRLQYEGVIGLSLARIIHDALESAGMLITDAATPVAEQADGESAKEMDKLFELLSGYLQDKRKAITWGSSNGVQWVAIETVNLRKIVALLSPLPVPTEAPAKQNSDLGYAVRIATHMAEKFWPDAPEWKPLGDLRGVLTQIDNMTCGLMRTPCCASVPTETQETAAKCVPAPDVLAEPRVYICASHGVVDCARCPLDVLAEDASSFDAYWASVTPKYRHDYSMLLMASAVWNAAQRSASTIFTDDAPSKETKQENARQVEFILSLLPRLDAIERRGIQLDRSNRVHEGLSMALEIRAVSDAIIKHCEEPNPYVVPLLASKDGQ